MVPGSGEGSARLPGVRGEVILPAQKRAALGFQVGRRYTKEDFEPRGPPDTETK